MRKSANAVSSAIRNYWDIVSGKNVKSIVVPQRSQMEEAVRTLGDKYNAVREAGFARAYESALLNYPNPTVAEKIRLKRDARNVFLLPSEVKEELRDLQEKQRRLKLDFDQNFADSTRKLEDAKSQRSSTLGYTGAALAGVGITAALAGGGSKKEVRKPIKNKQKDVGLTE